MLAQANQPKQPYFQILSKLLGFSLLFSLLLGLGQPPTPAHAALYTVTNLQDDGPGSLRAVIAGANLQSSPSLVDMSQLSGTLVLSATLPTIETNVTLVGPGANRLTIQAGPNANFRLLTNNGVLSLSRLTFSNGQAESGGAIYNTSNLTIQDCVFSQNRAIGGQGGNGTKDSPYPYSGGAGGGGGAGFGGAIFHERGVLNISNSTFSSNLAQGGKGGDGVATSGGGGGGAGFGGAVFIYSGTANIDNSTFSTNRAQGSDGGYQLSILEGSGGGGTGGGIQGGAAGIGGAFGAKGGNGGFGGGGGGEGTGNTLGAGIGGFGGGGGGAATGNGLAEYRTFPGGFGGGRGGSTLSINQNGGFGGSGFGSSIFVYNGVLNLASSTLTQNQNTAGNITPVPYNYGLPGDNAGSIYNYLSGALNVKNSIIANNTNTITSTLSPDVAGIINSGGYNLIEASTNVTITGTLTGNLNNVAPGLGTLQNNGGSTPTLALLSGSPAINAGNPAGCTNIQGELLATDGRGTGYPRSTNRRCDIGAFEYENLEVNSSADTTDDSCDPLNTGPGNRDCTLREALLAANFDNHASTITFTQSELSINVLSPLPHVTSKITIQGSCLTGGPAIHLKGSGLSSPGLILKGGVTLVGLRITGFKGPQLLISDENKANNKLVCVQVSPNDN